MTAGHVVGGEAELRGHAFPGWSLGTRNGWSLGTRNGWSLGTRNSPATERWDNRRWDNRRLRLVILLRGESAAHRVFGNVDRDEELQEVVRAAGFAADAGHAVAAEGVSLNKRSSDFTVEIQVTHLEFVTGSSQRCGAATVNSAGQGVARPVRDLQSFIQILRADDCQDRAEDLVLSQRRRRIDVSKNQSF